eukprot:scaffold4675_cov24-Phaeocystis_antarctica.AAC.2
MRRHLPRSTELPRAVRRALRRHRSRAGALPRGLDHAAERWSLDSLLRLDTGHLRRDHGDGRARVRCRRRPRGQLERRRGESRREEEHDVKRSSRIRAFCSPSVHED